MLTVDGNEEWAAVDTHKNQNILLKTEMSISRN